MKLSDFKDEAAIEVVAQLLPPIGRIAANPANKAARETNGSLLDFAAAMLQNNSADIMTMLAVLDGQDPAGYHCTAATVLRDTISLFSDPELLALFGLQSQTPASSGSASETTGAPEA